MSIPLNPLDFFPRFVWDGLFVFALYSLYEWMGYEDFAAGMLILLLLAVYWAGRDIDTEARQ